VDTETSKEPKNVRHVAALTTAAILGSLAGGGLLLAVTILRFQQSLPTFTPGDFYEARDRWASQAPEDYKVEVSVSGRQAATYYVEVRDGETVAATRNGDALTQHRTMGTWSVSGMFTTIHSDVINFESHQQGTANRQTPQVLLRGLFDEQYGFPRRYHRTELRKWGPNQEVMWEVTRFEILEK
jgi:hypothetical protein